jgi:hypothetical protein
MPEWAAAQHHRQLWRVWECLPKFDDLSERDLRMPKWATTQHAHQLRHLWYEMRPRRNVRRDRRVYLSSRSYFSIVRKRGLWFYTDAHLQ